MGVGYDIITEFFYDIIIKYKKKSVEDKIKCKELKDKKIKINKEIEKLEVILQPLQEKQNKLLLRRITIEIQEEKIKNKYAYEVKTNKTPNPHYGVC